MHTPFRARSCPQAAVLLVVALLGALAGAFAAGCSSGSKSNSVVQGGDQLLTLDSSSTAGPASTASTASTAGTASSATGPAGSSAPAAGTLGTTAGGGSPGSPDAHGPVGSFATAYLTPAVSRGVVVEVHAQPGASPHAASIDHLRSVLAAVTGKPVSERNGPAIPGGAHAWSADELRSLADAPGSAPQVPGSDLAVMRLLFVHGTFGDDRSVLGVSVRGDVAAIFIDEVAASASPLTGSERIETAVVTHEAGHLLGLVDLVLHTGRADPQHPGHSTNPGSVMYWAVESNLVSDLLQGGPPTEFDSEDLADLARIRAS